MSESPEALDARLTKEVTLLSTKLVTAVAKQSELEENVLHLHKENTNLKSSVNELKSFASKYSNLFPKYNQLYKDYQQLKAQKDSTETENKKLQSEVEDLSESLFNEANQMVSDALRETYNFKVKNRKLYEEIDEKNAIIDNLQDQLKDLKNLFIKIEDQQKLFQSNSKSNTPKLDLSQFTNDEILKEDYQSDDITNNSAILTSGENSLYVQQLQSIIYSPTVKAIRFDLAIYQQDFKSFIYQIIKPDFTFDLVNLQKLKFFKKIWQEELETSIGQVPVIPTSSFINRWQKGKNFWNLLVEGKAMIQPVSGINETFKLTYKGKNRNYNEVPVAVKDPCTFCGENKDDVLEHARLYTLKLFSPIPINQSPNNSINNNSGGTTNINGEKHEVIANYPLCNFCLIKLRNICEFFAKLRLINQNVYKLKQNNSYDEFAYSSNSNFQFKRNSGGLSDWEKLGNRRSNTSPSLSNSNHDLDKLSLESKENGGTVPKEARGIDKHQSGPTVDMIEESIIMKLYILLILIRNKIYWSKIGFWDNVDDIEELNIDEIHYDAFKIILEEEITLRHGKQIPAPPKKAYGSPIEKVPASPSGKAPASPSDLKYKKDKDDSEDEFADSSTTFTKETPIDNTVTPGDSPVKSTKEASSDHSLPANSIESTDSTDKDEVLEADSENKLTRKKSKSKQFKKKMNNDLNETMEMLRESIEH